MAADDKAPETKRGGFVRRNPTDAPAPAAETKPSVPNPKDQPAPKFGARPVQGNPSQVYPEASLGTTPTDPDIRAANDKSTAEQAAEGLKRRDPHDESATVDMKAQDERFHRRLREQDEARRGKETEVREEQYTGGKTTLKAGDVVQVRKDLRSSIWWNLKYNAEQPRLVIEGSVQNVFGREYGHRDLFGHYLFDEMRTRQAALPRNHPIRRKEEAIYVATVGGRRVLVHAFETEDIPDKSKPEQKGQPTEEPTRSGVTEPVKAGPTA